jgi:phosphonate transport system permease protein
MASRAEHALDDLEAARRGFTSQRARFWIICVVVLAFYAVSWNLAGIDLQKLAIGLPKLGHWIATAWPPKLDEVPLFALRTAETVAMAAIGTTVATVLAIPMAILASRNITPWPALYYPARWFLNALRGIDSFVFALLFVAAVGLGPFAGVLGIALHTWGSAAKFFADHVENANLSPFEAVRTTVLGVVGAGGIGQELKNSMDLLDFSRLFTIIAVILIVVTLLDQLSGWLRKRLV